MELKDYAKYYIGCRCVNTWFQAGHKEFNKGWVLSGYCQLYADGGKPFLLESENEVTWTDSIKLILRKLEDMNKDDAQFILDKYSFQDVEMPMNETKFAINIAKRISSNIQVVSFLLKEGYDLFGLIENGLAIDSKTLK